MARPHSCTVMIGIRSGPATMVRQPVPVRRRAAGHERQPTPIPISTTPTPSATPKEVVESRSAKTTVENTMPKKK